MTGVITLRAGWLQCRGSLRNSASWLTSRSSRGLGKVTLPGSRISRWNSRLAAAGFLSRSTLIFLANGLLMIFIGFSPLLFAESIEAAM